jgi:hypothetical protein
MLRIASQSNTTKNGMTTSHPSSSLQIHPNKHTLTTSNSIDQYALLGVDYKWFTKVLTMRLIAVTVSIISKTHITFMPRRNILEGVMVLHETLREMRRKKTKEIIMKLDFENVSWPFLMEVLERKNFPLKWIEWVQQAVTRGRVGINLNGEPGNYFRTFKRLRHGDPLSPLLFNMVVDTLATLMKKSQRCWPYQRTGARTGRGGG